MLSVFCYTEFAVEIPVAGGSFAYLRVELGYLAAFITAGNILLESVVGSAAISRAWTSYFTTLLDRHPNSLRIHTNLREGYNLLDPIAVGVLALATMLAIASAKKTSCFNWIVSAVNTVVIIFVTIAGFAHADTSNLNPFFPYGARGVFQASAIVYFAYLGFDSIATMAEETKNSSREIPLGLLGSMSMITVIYCLMALCLSTMVKYTDIDPNAAYSVAFQSMGMKWAKYLVAVGALKGMTTRGNNTKESAHADELFAADYCFFDGYFCLLGFETRGGLDTPTPSQFGSSLATLGIAVLLSQERQPKVWGVPLVPWLPSLSITVNLFLMGSLGAATFIRFGVCTIIMLVYYVLFGVHATYDMAQQMTMEPFLQHKLKSVERRN
ncbi:hypothetical protein ACS0TY_034374 [Phlomoides rotata]